AGLPDEADSPPSLHSIVMQDVILAPLETSNLPRILETFFQEMRTTYDVQSEVARRYAGLQAATADERVADAYLSAVARHRETITRAPQASLESCLALQNEIRPEPGTPLGASLNQCIGLALYALGAPTMAAIYLDEALGSNTQVDAYSETFERFLSAARTTGYVSANPLRIKAHADAVTGSVRTAFLYFMGYSLVFGPNPDPTLAKQILANIQPGDISYPKAQILTATLNIRGPEFRFKSAAENLERALKALSTLKGDESFQLTNTAWLMLARIAFENHAYEASDAFYRRVDVRSHQLRHAILENAWGHVFSKNYAGALSLTHALHAPVFRDTWLADVFLIEASAYLGLCRYSQAMHSLEALRASYLAQAPQIQSFISATPARDYYNLLQTHARGPKTLPEHAFARILSDRRFYALHRILTQLASERAALIARGDGRLAGIDSLLSVYDEALSKRRQYMSALLGQILDATLSELHAIDITATQLSIEIRMAQRAREAECLQKSAAGEVCRHEDDAQSMPPTYNKRDQDAFWRFDGEFWRDEWLFYVSGLGSLCGPGP
ncbi:MAG: hypothetical protein FWC40_06905, partial [Proteobacteria bacterium]|nr:hypothetical protein [Pseudomonadota bacterium]